MQGWIAYSSHIQISIRKEFLADAIAFKTDIWIARHRVLQSASSTIEQLIQ